MSESERAAAEAAERTEGASELAPDPGPGVTGRASSVTLTKESRRVSSSSERQIKVERAQKCLENAALVSKRIKERRRATAELLGKTFEDEESCDMSSDMVSVVSGRTGCSSVTVSDLATPMSVEDALNIPGISESLANTLKQKEIIMERIKQYKERSKRVRPVAKPSKTPSTSALEVSSTQETSLTKKIIDKSDSAQLHNTIKEKETAISIMQVKMRAMETTILDLQEKISEKDSLIEAKTKASSLMSDNLSKKEKDSVNLLEDTRQQMVKMQENFVSMENEWREEKQRMLNEIELKNERVNHLEQANAVLENSRFETSLANSKLSEEIQLKNKLISDLQDKLDKIDNSRSAEMKEVFEEEKGSQEISNMVEMTKRIELLEQLNCQIRQTNVELENKLATMHPEVRTSEPSPKKASPLATRKRGKSASRSTSSKVKSPWTELAESSAQDASIKIANKCEPVKDEISKMERVIQSLNKEIVDKELLISEKDLIIQKQVEMLSQKDKEINNQPKPSVTVEIGLNCDLIKPQRLQRSSSFEDDSSMTLRDNQSTHLTMEELHRQLDSARQQIISLNTELEAANKNMVKVKLAHKLKLKQMQKTIDGFSKMSDANAEVSKLSDEVNQLTQKVAELEEDKGNLQLHLVDYDSGRLSESDSHRKLAELEALAEARLKAISDLETQKFDLVQELHSLRQINSKIEDKLADLQQLHNENVCIEMRSVQLEEQLDRVTAENKELALVIENLKLDKDHLKQSIKDFEEKDIALTNKLDNYIQENIDLTDRLEKLSAEKVSSAESIEMVESLTAQEKLELEEYSNKMPYSSETFTQSSDGKHFSEEVEKAGINEKLVEISQESAELHKKIELFTHERHEVMEKMCEYKLKNEELQNSINEINIQKESLEAKFQLMLEEKEEIKRLNESLLSQIDILKKEQLEVLREHSRFIKPIPSEDAIIESEGTSKDVNDGVCGDNINSEDKPQASKTKSTKQLTKDILKLKNVIKEREAEIADCQMKILSLEEQHQKQSELLKNNMVAENTLRTMLEENNQLKEELAQLKLHSDKYKELESLKQANEELHNIINSSNNEYSALLSTRNSRIQELEVLLNEYEGKIVSFNDSLQQKDKDITEYLNQIKQLNGVSQKLKSTIEVLEEEKLKDQNGELIKNLNMQIITLQGLINELESKLSIYEDEKSKLFRNNMEISEKNSQLENEIKKMYNSLLENEKHMKELQDLHNKHKDEVVQISNQCKERDEEIHEIKLQLRKESIENENLRKTLNEIELYRNDNSREIEILKQDYEQKLHDKETELENKNKELMDKLKKFAANLKKKTNICAEQEGQISKLNIDIESKQKEIENLIMKLKSMPLLEDQVSLLNRELDSLKSESLDSNKVPELEARVVLLLEEKSDLIDQQRHLENNLIAAKQEIEVLDYNNTSLTNELGNQQQQMQKLNAEIEMLNNKLSSNEIEQKNNIELVDKISNLESQIQEKHLQISELLMQIDSIQQEFNTFKFGHNAKIQERDLFIENLESEIFNYKSRIARLEESISVMEDSRHSLERKADHVGTQLDEKQKAYSDYSSNEDVLVNRLAVLMEHDQVVEKQLQEIEKENADLQNKIQKLLDDNQNLHRNLILSQEECANLKINIIKEHQVELDLAQQRNDQLETQIKKMASDNQSMMKNQQNYIHTLEAEFNLQLENNVKEKKVLNEKYEKLLEHNCGLEHQLQAHVENIKTLTENIVELNELNMQDHENSQNSEQTIKIDYTEQYISEINNLQSIINKKNADIDHLQSLIMDRNNIIAKMECEVNKLNEDLKEKVVSIEGSTQTLQVSEQFSYLPDIQSDLEGLESQIIVESDKSADYLIMRGSIIKLTEHDSSNQNKNIFEKESHTQDSIEDIIIPKQAYLCYDEVSGVKPELSDEVKCDVFNSDEGWGLGENISESGDNDNVAEINRLFKENENLKSEVTSSNTKLTKALKKLKELKLKNERLANEAKQSNDISQFNLLDNAIEDELKNQIRELNEKIVSMSADISKEKREKEKLCKQNELFQNANDRILEMKEKLENEIIIWKNKFKEANDKVSSFEWGDDKEISISKQSSKEYVFDETKKQSIIEQLEKENEEFSVSVEQLTLQIGKLSDLKSQQVEKIASLTDELSHLKSEIAAQKNSYEDENCILKSTLMELESEIKTFMDHNLPICEICPVHKEDVMKLKKQVDVLTENNNFLVSTVEKLRSDLEAITLECRNYENANTMLQNEIFTLKQCLDAANDQIKLQCVVKTSETDHADVLKKIVMLEEKCETLGSQLEISSSQCNDLKDELKQANDKNIVSEAEITEYKNKISKLNEENDQLLSTLAELRSSVTAAVDQRGFEVAEMWKQHLTQRESDFSNIEHELREQISAIENKYELLLDNVQSSTQEETSKMIMMEQISSFQAKLNDKDDYIISMKDKMSNTISEMERLRSEVEDEKLILENKLLSCQEEADKKIIELENQVKKEILHKDSTIAELNEELEKNKQTILTLHNEIKDSDETMELLKSNINTLTSQVHYKDSEIKQKMQEYNIILTQRNEELDGLREHLIVYEKKVEDLSFEKESELAILRLQLHDLSTNFEKEKINLETEKTELFQTLSAKIEECNMLNKQLRDLNKSLEEDSAKMSEMRLVLENQEVEIVTLKDEIDNMQILLESSAARVAKHVSFATGTKSGTDGSEAGDDDRLQEAASDLVPRAELDLALYMLHQRDMRCEELTMELTGLLEERDTLQLRLSDCLRAHEELRARSGSEAIGSEFVTESTIPISPVLPTSSRSGSLTEANLDKATLHNKLDELRSVRQSRDVRLRGDSERRQLDMQLLQRDVARLPPEAADQLRQAHYTLTRDSQSTSTVLLNWLRGKSTPKVVHM